VPKTNDPKTLRVGVGQRSSEQSSVELNSLTTPYTQGDLNQTPESQANTVSHEDAEINSGSSQTHVEDGKSAHVASAISFPHALFDKTDVSSILTELAALQPQKTPMVGKFKTYLDISGIPDWGVLKLADAPLPTKDAGSFTYTSNEANEVFPQFWYPTHPAQQNKPFEPNGDPLTTEGGNDPETDLTFNVDDGTYTGGGAGKAHGGAFNRGGSNIETLRIMPYEGGGYSCVLSGMVFPADRGVMALYHWPSGYSKSEFDAQPLQDKVVAAIKLGKGLESGCDGDTNGEWFSLGEDSGDFDPYAFPGLATGQFDLSEIHNGVYSSDMGSLAGNPLPAPYNVANPDAGKVRLGTDPNAGLSPITGGIPILGGTSAATGGGNDNNFFRYRLPYIEDYTNLKYVPVDQKPRFYKKPTVSLNPSVDLTQGGDYTNFERDYWIWQMARFRHRFPLSTAATTPLRESGSYFLLHFKTEEAFERFTRDGDVPVDDDLYTPNIPAWNDIEDVQNIASSPDVDGAAESYHVLRSTVVEDDNGSDNPTYTTTDMTLTNVGAVDSQIMYYSGVAYFMPRNLATGNRDFKINSWAIAIDDLFDASYRNSELSSSELHTNNPLLWYFGAFSHEAPNTRITVPATMVTTAADQIRRQRVELRLNDIAPVIPPATGDTATVTFNGGDEITFEGDLEEPSFSQNAVSRLFVRRPVGHQNAATALSPLQGQIVSETSGDEFLSHSSRHPVAGGDALHGNFLTGFPTRTTFASPTVAYNSVESADKDTEDRFLDEVYRYQSQFANVPNGSYWRDALQGPGLNPSGSYVATDIEVPVRAGSTLDVNFRGDAWIQQGLHFLDLANDVNVALEAQIAGLPDRNPPFTDGVVTALPSRGICQYPLRDYSTGIRPSLVDGDLSQAQFDYSTAVDNRYYVRAFDLNFSRSAAPIVVTGESQFTLRVYGVAYSDLTGTAPGGAAVAVEVKLPGRTVWMDVGVADDPANKNDATNDGAGCYISHTSGVVESTGVRFVDLVLSTAPHLFFTSANGEAPILVRVTIKDNAAGKAFKLDQGGVDASTTAVSGVLGLKIIKPE
jgi:hypothetical protein